MGISVRRGGDSSDPALLLIHGLGATGHVWDGLIAGLAPRWEWVAPDLPGHGGSSPLPHEGAGYSFGGFAAALTQVIDRDRPVAILGHSLGGVVGLALASGGSGATVTAVCGLGMKVQWSEPELAKAREIASRPPRVFDTRTEAIDRALKVAGLTGLVSPESPAATTSVVQAPAGWWLAMDPAAFAVGRPDMPSLLAAARAPVILAAGEHDPMGPPAHLRELDPDAVVLSGLGHNAHVENPAALAPLLERLRATTL